jgi:hypothetical protein
MPQAEAFGCYAKPAEAGFVFQRGDLSPRWMFRWAEHDVLASKRCQE